MTERAILIAVARLDLLICSPWPRLMIALILAGLACLIWRD